MFATLTAHFTDRPACRRMLEGPRAFLVGRGSDCDLVLDDDRISRRHVRLEAPADPEDGVGWLVTDLNSKNGTSVDGRSVLPGTAGRMSLPKRCWLDLGGLPVRFEELSADEARTERDRREQRWRTTLALQRRLDPGLGLESLLRQMLDSVIEVSGAERAFVLLEPSGRTGRADCEGSRLEVAAVSGMEEEALTRDSFAGSVGAVERCLASGRPVVSADAVADPSLGERPSVAEHGIRALVCLPLEVLGRLIGAVYADSTGASGRRDAFTELDLEILDAVTSYGALAVAVARLDREALDLGAQLPTRDSVRRDTEPVPMAARGTSWSALVAAHAEHSGSLRSTGSAGSTTSGSTL